MKLTDNCLRVFKICPVILFESLLSIIARICSFWWSPSFRRQRSRSLSLPIRSWVGGRADSLPPVQSAGFPGWACQPVSYCNWLDKGEGGAPVPHSLRLDGPGRVSSLFHSSSGPVWPDHLQPGHRVGDQHGPRQVCQLDVHPQRGNMLGRPSSLPGPCVCHSILPSHWVKLSCIWSSTANWGSKGWMVSMFPHKDEEFLSLFLGMKLVY